MKGGRSKRDVEKGHGVAMTVKRLVDKGLSHREIADIVGKKPEQIKGLILLAERFEAPTP